MKKMIVIISSICLVLIGVTVALIIINNNNDKCEYPEEYLIATTSTMDYQENNQCSGYAAAYVLRVLGDNITGTEAYNLITNKNNDGTVSPLALSSSLDKAGYDASLKKGSLDKLKYQVSKGTPVIVFVKTSPLAQALHYIDVVGYDSENIYVVDSLYNYANTKSTNYNRTISTEDFLTMWDTQSTFGNKNLYITISK